MPDVYARTLGEAVQLNHPAPKPDDLTCCVCGVPRRPHVMFRYGEQRHRCPDCHAANRRPRGHSETKLTYFQRYYQKHKAHYAELKRQQRARAKAARTAASGG